MTVSYFEWVQDIGRLFWTRDEIRAKLAEKLSDAFDRVWNLAEERDVSLRTAALVSGIREVSKALEAREYFREPRAGCVVSHPGRLPGGRVCKGRREASATARGARHLRHGRGTARRGRHAKDARPRGGGCRTRSNATELGEIAELPDHTIGPDVPLEDAFRFLEGTTPSASRSSTSGG